MTKCSITFLKIFDVLSSAYRGHHSHQAVSLIFVEYVNYALERSNMMGAVFIDLSKGFECLPHPHGLIITKLHVYCCSMAACELISNYLTNRQQCVMILSNCNTRRPLSKGLSQCSILGPLHFNIFINDILLFMEICNFYNYADDNFLWRSSPDLNVILSNLKNDCHISLKWFANNGTKANSSKFKLMIMSSEYIEPQELTISDDFCIQSQTAIKVLGVTIDHRKTFTEHIPVCALKAARELNALSWVSRYLDTKSKGVSYNTFVGSSFLYFCPVCRFCGVTNNNNVKKNSRTSTAHLI